MDQFYRKLWNGLSHSGNDELYHMGCDIAEEGK